MLETLELTPELSSMASDPAQIRDDVLAACRRVPPLWDLSNYVAVNPFLGFTSEPIQQAVATVEQGLDCQVLPSLDYYRKKWTAGELDQSDLRSAAARSGIDPDLLRSVLTHRSELSAYRNSQAVRTFAEQYDRQHGTNWREQILRSVARWCAVYAAEGGETWRIDRQRQSLFASWLEAARVDRSLELIGLRGWRNWLRKMPEEPASAIVQNLNRLAIPPEQRVDYLYRLLGSLFGWASYFRRSPWQAGTEEPDDVGDLLAILLCAEAWIAQMDPRATFLPADVRVEDESIRLALQEAVEDRYLGQLVASIKPPPAPSARKRPAVHAVFCIDVRSELLRRHLEAQSNSIETLGFAGFFGVSLNWQPGGLASSRCPVLLKPSVSLKPLGESKSSAAEAALRSLQSAPAGAFSFVEVLGLTYGLKLAADTCTVGGDSDHTDEISKFDLTSDPSGQGLSPADQVNLAAGILKNTGLQRGCARLVLLCGHVGHSENNPHAAGLDCGACGGHGGAINARVAAALLNNPTVRKGLAERGITVPADTHFLPAVHDTSTDDVRILDSDRVPATHLEELATLQAWLKVAGQQVRQERATGLGIPNRPPGKIDRILHRRARDWSEVRPEWALARNAAFIVARRERTRLVNLEGRAFLHEYDASQDSDGSILALILSAPMVVASWINLQYFASTVDNDVFGSGNKAIHHRIGSLGVVLGNGGDLRTGLAKQSVHSADGTWFHEPLRLQVIVEATTRQLESVLQSQSTVRELIDNEWVRLVSLDPNGSSSWLRLPGGEWEAVTL